MEDGSLQVIERGSADPVEPYLLQPKQKVTGIELRHMMQTLELEDALVDSVHHARHFGQHDIALSLAMILESLRVRLWEPSSDSIAICPTAEV